METINATPARNTNNTNVQKALDELNKLFENLTKHEQEHPNETFGYSGIPHCLELARKIGADKLFFVSRDYHGKYEDDYCYFKYWNEVTKEFVDDEWGTWAAFPSYDYYEMPVDFGAAWEAGLIDKEAYLEKQKAVILSNIDSTTICHKDLWDFNLRVSIDGGRKWKGEGYLINIEESSYRYASPMFRNKYYGVPKDFGVSTTHTAVIWDPMNNTINRANAKYLKFTDLETITEKYKEWAKNVVNKATVYDIKPINGNAHNFGLYLRVDYMFITFMDNVWMKEHPMYDISDAYDPEMEAKKKKESEFRATKMPELIEWVKNNTEKKGDEILELAIHIYEKRYGKNQD